MMMFVYVVTLSTFAVKNDHEINYKHIDLTDEIIEKKLNKTIQKKKQKKQKNLN